MGIVFVPYMMQEIEDPRELRVSMNLMWLVQGVFRLPIYIAGGIITQQYILTALSVIPFMLVAQDAGRRIHNRIHPEHFHRLILCFLALLVLARLTSEWL
jgi:uncharacterized membrane protein YfcA